MTTGSALPIMFSQDSVETVRLPELAALTPESIREVEKAAAESRAELDEANAHRREERGVELWQDELDQLQTRFNSIGTVPQAKNRAASVNESCAEAVKELQQTAKKVEELLKGCDRGTRGFAEKKLEKLNLRLAEAKRRQEVARRQGEYQVRCAQEFAESGDLDRLYALQQRRKLREQTISELKNL